jgi:hypothetical protein
MRVWRVLKRNQASVTTPLKLSGNCQFKSRILAKRAMRIPTTSRRQGLLGNGSTAALIMHSPQPTNNSLSSTTLKTDSKLNAGTLLSLKNLTLEKDHFGEFIRAGS